MGLEREIVRGRARRRARAEQAAPKPHLLERGRRTRGLAGAQIGGVICDHREEGETLNIACEQAPAVCARLQLSHAKLVCEAAHGLALLAQLRLKYGYRKPVKPYFTDYARAEPAQKVSAG